MELANTTVGLLQLVDLDKWLWPCVGCTLSWVAWSQLVWEGSSVITQILVYQANKVGISPELWCNGSMPDVGSGDSRFESSKL